MLSDVKTRAAMITISCSNIVNNDLSNLCALFFYLFIYFFDAQLHIALLF